jgi:hypothetical protein
MRENFTLLFLVLVGMVSEGQVVPPVAMNEEKNLVINSRERVFITALPSGPSGGSAEAETFPHPLLTPDGFTGILQIDPQCEFTSVKIFDPYGKKVCCPRLSVYRIDLSGQSKGVYTIQIENGEEKKVQKILIE